MLASDTSDVIVAAISGFAGIVASVCAAWAAISVARMQQRPKMVVPAPSESTEALHDRIDELTEALHEVGIPLPEGLNGRYGPES